MTKKSEIGLNKSINYRKESSSVVKVFDKI